MSKLQEAAIEHANGFERLNPGQNEDIQAARIVGFKRGAEWQSKQSTWISVEDRLPEDNQLALTSSSIYGTKLLVWNDHYKVWDDEDGDDVYCERDKIDAWMPIAE